MMCCCKWQVTPAPDIPPEIKRQFKRLEWITYRLRRAFLEGTPSKPVQALASAGLNAPGNAKQSRAI